jgi:hypothetical protein
MFVMTMYKDGEYSSLIRFNLKEHSLLRFNLKEHSLLHGMNDAKNLACYLILGSKEKSFELLKINLSAPEILSKYNELMDEKGCISWMKVGERYREMLVQISSGNYNYYLKYGPIWPLNEWNQK